MKAFDHDKPGSRDEWVFAFVGRYRELRAKIGERYAKTNASLADSKLERNLPTLKAAEKWFKEPQ